MHTGKTTFQVQNMDPSPYMAALIAHNDPDGAGWYLVDAQNRIWNVSKFGSEWLLCQPDDASEPPLWRRWTDLGPVCVMLDGCQVGIDLWAEILA